MSSTCNLKAFQWNANGLTPDKIEQIRENLRECKPDIIAIQETKWSPSTGNVVSLIIGGEQYHCYHNARPPKQTKQAAGGVAIFVRQTPGLTHRKIHATNGSFINCEALTVEIRQDGLSPLAITSAYVSDKELVTVDALDHTLPLYNGRHVVMADLNSHHTIWDLHMLPTPSGKTILEWLPDGMTIVNDPLTPTRRAHPRSNGLTKSSPDMTLVKETEVTNWRVNFGDLSDHAQIRFEISDTPVAATSDNVTYRKRRFCFQKSNWKKFRDLVDERCTLIDGNDVRAYTMMAEAIRHAAAQSIPKGWYTGVKDPCNERIKEATTLRGEARQEYDEFPNPHSHQRLLEARRACTEVIREERQRRFVESVEKMKQDDKTAWKRVRNATRGISTIEEITLMKGDQVLTKPREKAKALLKQYADISTAPADKGVPNMAPPDKAIARQFTMCELQTALNKMKGGKAAGPDGIHSEMLQQLSPKAKELFLTIANRSLETGQLPTEWTTGEIIPLLKPEKEPTDLKSYRPVTLTSHSAKVVERMIATRALYTMSSKLHEAQYGFRKRRSTTDALIDIHDFIMRSWNEVEKEYRPGTKRTEQYKVRKRVVSVLLDFTSAFDTMSHAAIAESLQGLGINGHELQWILSFLDNRTAHVRVGHCTTKPKRFTAGVPQGTVLGPMLFIACMDTLLKRLSTIPKLHLLAYADDLTISAAAIDATTATHTLQKGLDDIKDWTTWSNMRVNIEKTKAVILTHSEAKTKHNDITTPLKYEGNDIETSYRDGAKRLLGVWLDTGLHFQQHKDITCEQAEYRNQLGALLARRTEGITPRMLRAFHKGYVEAKMLHAAEIIWDRTNDRGKDELRAAHRASARRIRGLPIFTNTDAMHIETNTVPLDTLIEQRTAITAVRYQCGTSRQQEIFQLPKQTPTKTKYSRGTAFFETHLTKAKRTLDTILGPAGLHSLTVADAHETGDIPPWETDFVTRVEFNPQAHQSPKSSLTQEEQKKHSLEAVERHGQKEWEIWVDGSVSDHQTSGAAAVLVHNDRTVETQKRATGPLASSTTAELWAVEMALERLCQLGANGEIICISDSQATVKELSSGPLSQGLIGSRTWNHIQALTTQPNTSIVFQHVFSHCGIEHNEAADIAAKEAAEDGDNMAPTLVSDACAAIKRLTVRKYLAQATQQMNHRAEAAGTKLFPLENAWKREDVVTASQLRTGSFPKLGKAHRRLHPLVAPSCRWCCPLDHPLAEGELKTEEGKPYECPYCPPGTEPSKNKRNLGNHVARHHPDKLKEWERKNTHKFQKRKCDFCSHVVRNPARLQRHVATAHRKQLAAWKAGTEAPTPMDLRCRGGCEARFQSERSRSQHEKRAHQMQPQQQEAAVRPAGSGPDETLKHILVCPVLREARKETFGENGDPVTLQHACGPGTSALIAFVRIALTQLSYAH